MTIDTDSSLVARQAQQIEELRGLLRTMHKAYFDLCCTHPDEKHGRAFLTVDRELRSRGIVGKR